MAGRAESFLEVVANSLSEGTGKVAEGYQGAKQQNKGDAIKALMLTLQMKDEKRKADAHEQATLMGALQMDNLNKRNQRLSLDLSKLSRSPSEKAAADVEGFNAFTDQFGGPQNVPLGMSYKPPGGDISFSPVDPLGADLTRSQIDATDALANQRNAAAEDQPSDAEVRNAEKYAESKRQTSIVSELNKLYQTGISDEEKTRIGKDGLAAINTVKDAEAWLAKMMKTGGRTKDRGTAVFDWLVPDDKDPKLIEKVRGLIAEYQKEGAAQKLVPDVEAWGKKTYGDKWDGKNEQEKQFLWDKHGG